jgi:aminoacyl-tRNA hydrolase
MKFLIVGLGNIGVEYAHTRHNIGFDIADELVRLHKGIFENERYADYAHLSVKGKQLHVIKPTTYMNLSGKAVRYWMDKLSVPIENVIVLVDDLAIDFGKIRIHKNCCKHKTILGCALVLEVIFPKVVRWSMCWVGGIPKKKINSLN